MLCTVKLNGHEHMLGSYKLSSTCIYTCILIVKSMGDMYAVLD